MLITELNLALPAWLRQQLSTPPASLPDTEQRMAWVLQLARQNIRAGTGGPFAAAVFDAEGQLIAAGVNLVLSSGLSCAHAEMVALSLAERQLQHFDLSGRQLQLVSSAEPCVMCLGAVHWAGVSELVYAACDEDVRAIGFDEGYKPQDWAAALRGHGIRVVPGVLREEGRAVLSEYRTHGGAIYNAGMEAP